MYRIPARIRIFAALFFAVIIVRILPVYLSSSPHVPSREEVLHIVSLLSIPSTKINIQSTSLTPFPTNNPFFITVTPSVLPSNPTVSPPYAIPTLFPLPTILVPSVSPTHGIIPTLIPIIVPTKIISPSKAPLIPTAVPTIRPPAVPTNVPTAIPTPTTPSAKTANYSKLNALAADPPQIGCANNTVTGCPYSTLYNSSVTVGLGWATFYGDSVVPLVIKNRKGISQAAAEQFINDTSMSDQSNLTPQQAKDTGRVIAYGATRSPADLWRIKYLFGIDNAKSPQARFIGRVMIIDCAAANDWKTSLAIRTYSYLGWSRLNWIIDLSRNGFTKIPTGLSGNWQNVGEGRPGVILVDEANLDQYIY